MRCNLSLFKFSNHLQDRMELLLDKKKTDELALEEIAELEAIGMDSPKSASFTRDAFKSKILAGLMS